MKAFLALAAISSTGLAEVPPFELLATARARVTFPETSPAQKQFIANQVAMVLRDVWVNDAYKQRDLNIAILPQINQIVRDAPTLATEEFHGRIAAVIENLRDLHTSYSLPKPYSCHNTALPIAFTRGRDSAGVERIAVQRFRAASSILVGTPYESQLIAIKKGDVLVEYEGKDTPAALRDMTSHSGGANAAAMEAFAVGLLDLRWQGHRLLPTKDTASMQLRHADGSVERFEVPWLVISDTACLAPAASNQNAIIKHDEANSLQTEAAERAKALRILGEAQEPSIKIIDSNEPKLKWGVIENSNGRFGYIKLKDFMPDKLKTKEQFIPEVANILLALRDTQGLLIDLRGNPGGNAGLAQAMVQLFTPHKVDDVGVRMRASETNRLIMELPQWKDSPSAVALRAAMATGKDLTASFPFIAGSDFNSYGQFYFAPVAVLVDPTCFSSCDIFSAQMQDTRAATIWGTNGWQTGGGGANVINYSAFRAMFAAAKIPEELNPFKELPFGQEMTIGWRQVHRVGLHNGQAVEDNGVQTDRVVFASIEEAVNGKTDNLFLPVTKKLAIDFAEQQSAFNSDARTYQVATGNDLKMNGQLVHTDRVQAVLNDQEIASIDTRSAQDVSLVLPLAQKPVGIYKLELNGFVGDRKTWRVVNTVRVVPPEILLGSEGIALDFSRPQEPRLGVYTWSPVSTTGWQIASGRLVSNTTAKYADQSTSLASIFVDFSNSASANLSFDASIDTEKDYDFFQVYAVVEGKMIAISDALSGQIGAASYTFDISALAGKHAEIVFSFRSDDAENSAGVMLDNIKIK